LPAIKKLLNERIEIAEICLELVLMAKGANLTLVAHLVAMAQAEAECAAESVA
jgi:hypothetical protein